MLLRSPWNYILDSLENPLDSANIDKIHIDFHDEEETIEGEEEE